MKTPTLDSQLCFALYSASSHLTNIYRPLLETLDLTYPQFMVMMALWENDGVTISTLSERMSLGKPTMSQLLKRLEAKHMITRESVGDDERKKIVRVTSAGQALAKKAGKVTTEAFCATGLTKTEAIDVMRICHKLVKSKHE